MKNILLTLLLFMFSFVLTGQYVYVDSDASQFGINVPSDVYGFDRATQSWFFVSVAQTSTTTLSAAITAGEVDYIDTGGTGGVPNVFSGTELGTATSNAAALLSDFGNFNEVIIPQGFYDIGSITIPAGRKLIFQNGAYFDVVGTMVGNFTEIEAGMYQIFDINSDIQGTWSVGEAYVEWFGAKGDGTGTYDAAAIQKTMEVFNSPSNIGYGTKESDMFGNGTVVKASGDSYRIESTITFPKFGNLEVGHKTIMRIDTNDFFDPAVYITRAPYKLKGGVWLVPHYEEQIGYAGSAQDDAAKIQYAYNTNPVIKAYMLGDNHTTATTANFDRSSMNSISNLSIRLRSAYSRTDPITSSLLFDGMFLQADTTTLTSGGLTFRHVYRVVDYKAGDDFTGNGLFGISGTPNTTGYRFVVGIASDYYPDSLYVPANWTNGSGVKDGMNGEYFHNISDLYFYNSDTAIYIQGDELGEGVIYTGDNFVFDGCNSSFVIGTRSWSNVFTNVYIQVRPASSFGILPSVDIRGSQNSITGTLMDMYHDSTVFIGDGVSGNYVNLSTQGDRLLEDFTKYENNNYSYYNLVGTHPMFNRAIDPTLATSNTYWFNGARMGVNNKDLSWLDRDVIPAAILTVHGKDNFAPEPAVLIESHSSGYVSSPSTALNSLTGFSKTLALSSRVGGTQTQIRHGVGANISFYVNPEEDAQTNTFAYELGRMGFRQNGAFVPDGSYSTIKSNFQIWNKNGTDWVQSLTIDPTGQVGIGTAYPSAKFEINSEIGIGDLDSDTAFVYTDDGRVGIGTATPSVALDVRGDGKFTGTLTASTVKTNTTTLSTAGLTQYDVLSTDHIIFVNTSTITASTIDIDLPDVHASGTTYIIKDYGGSASTKTIIIYPQGGDTIDGAVSISISSDYGSVSVVSDGTDWFTF